MTVCNNLTSTSIQPENNFTRAGRACTAFAMQQSSITGFFKKAPRPNVSRDNGTQPSNERQERRPGPYRSRGGHSTPSTRGQHRGGKSPRNMELRRVAEETKTVLPAVLKSLPGFGADVSSVHDLNGLAALDATRCPGHVLPNNDKDSGKRTLDKFITSNTRTCKQLHWKQFCR
ncbi:hypothetical protein OPT61_g10684 [Boeremia exigua]|uniref:Uncharacterized protein n=1 Tax=Boeremia exigua TaxID=749465 RepID=A0ACC2HNP9_9PLEO|nr:hypothetical protein OPT61_g10684 [Boeremia exigua]